MAIEVLTKEPSFMRAGDSYQWRVTYGDYLPSDGWSLSYKLINPYETREITASTDGDVYTVSLTLADTTIFSPGKHDFVGYVTNGGDRVTVYKDVITILPNLAGQDAGTDNRSNAKKALDVMDAALAAMGSKAWTQSYTINNKSISFRSFKEFSEFRDKLKREVFIEDQETARLMGRKKRNKISVVL